MNALRNTIGWLSALAGALAMIAAVFVFCFGLAQLLTRAATVPVSVIQHADIRVEVGSNHADPISWGDTDQRFTVAIANLSSRHFDRAGVACDAIKANGHIAGHENGEVEDLGPGVTKDERVWIYGTAGRSARISCNAYVIEHAQ